MIIKEHKIFFFMNSGKTSQQTAR